MTESTQNKRVNRKRGKSSDKRRKKRSIWKKVFAIIGIIGAMAVMAVMIYLVTIIGTLEDLDPDSLVNYEQTSMVFDNQDNLISSIHGVENRIYVPLNQIPEHVQNAFIAVEDVRFRTHPGFDVRRMFGSLWQNIKARDIVAGAGTITQQVIRNTVLSQEQTIDRKVKEILLAWQLEQKYSKDQILELYLNIVYFAKGAYGIEAASKTYFGKTVSELTVAEGALLAGILKNPHRNSPFIDKERSLERKDLAIDLMVKNEYLTPEEGEEAKKEKIQFAEDIKPAYVHGYFMDLALEEAASLLNIKQEELFTGGYRIYTTMDNELQEYVEHLYSQEDLFPKSPASGKTCESALVIMDTGTGELQAVMGGRTYPEGQRYVLNRADARRSPGSAVKPLVVYAPAVEIFDYTPVSFIEDAPVTFEDYDDYSPRNAGGNFRGIVTVRTALAKSINVPAVKILHEIGIGAGLSVAEKLGITFAESDWNNLAVALGGMEKGVTPLELARAYATLGDRGSYKNYTTIRRIDDSMGKTLYQSQPVKEQVISEETAFIVNNILQSAADTGGTAHRLKGLNVAAKTGTVQLPKTAEYANIDGTNDTWVAAYNPEYTVTVWMGFDKRTTEDYLPPDASGSTYTTIIAKHVFEHLYEGKDKPNFQKPVGVTEVKLDGKALWEQNRVLLASALTPAEYVVKEYFVRGTEPTEQSDYWVVPNAPYNFNVTLNDDEKPVISFVPRDTFAVYIIMKSVEGQAASAVHQIQTGGLDLVEWTDTEVTPGETYQYFIIPVHPEMKLDGEPVRGPRTDIVSVDIPGQSLIDDNIWDDILDWFRPGDNQGDEEIPDDQDGQDYEISP
ncbi:MAG: transglycosylase domain-containing protein [Caldicoprobacterales bacterium]|nr:PBP1A family penicillin-binding protein [Clostridiales bacterium]